MVYILTETATTTTTTMRLDGEKLLIAFSTHTQSVIIGSGTLEFLFRQKHKTLFTFEGRKIYLILFLYLFHRCKSCKRLIVVVCNTFKQRIEGEGA